jgi:hypothetical protein
MKKIYYDNYKEISFEIEEESHEKEIVKILNSDGTTSIYLSKLHILKNQRNLPILSQNNLLHLFK